MNLQFATMETDFTNPMVFDVKSIKEQEKEMKVELGDDVDVTKWRSIYPCYFDKNKTIQEGRRLPKENCIEDPNIHVIGMALNLLKVRHVQQIMSRHPRDYFTAGRLKCEILDTQGNPKNPEIRNKKDLFKKMSMIWPQAIAQYEKKLEAQRAANEEKKKQMEEMRKKAQ